MPELPEVETIRRQLEPLVKGGIIDDVELLDPRWIAPLARQEWADAVTGRRIIALERRGKYLHWVLEGQLHLMQHLRMSGAVLCDPELPVKHLRAVIEVTPRRELRGAVKRLRLAITDQRRFGTAELVFGDAAATAFLQARLGPEPFGEGFDAEHLWRASRGRAVPIKALLLDQRQVAGIGNIYADEALFRAGVHPARSAGTLTRKQARLLHDGILDALQEGIEAKGASIDDFKHIDGLKGSFQDRFLVHRRAGEPCPGCGSEIRKIVVAGRGTYVCERCQPRPRAPHARAATPHMRTTSPPNADAQGSGDGSALERLR